MRKWAPARTDAAFMSGLHHSVYNLLVRVVQPLLRRKLARRAVAEPGYGVAIEERVGVYAQPTEPRSELVWVHAVSLGESRAAGVLLAALREAMPGVRVLLTHGTATGRAEGVRYLHEGDVQVWQPWDTPAAVQAFLQHFKPRVGLLMETEVWPNLVWQAQRAGVPLALVNARMSEKSLQSALKWAGLMRPVFARLTAVWAQTDADAQRLQQLGAKVQAVTGNLKFDAQPDAAQVAQANVWRERMPRPVVMLASSREGEEALWLEAVKAQASGGVQVLIVPRHPQRVDEVELALQKAGHLVSRRSQWGDAGPTAVDSPTVWLGDSLGEMALYYSLADVALLGGSFAPLGGQNLIEAAACGCPVLMGPHTFNFAEVAEQALATGAAWRCADMQGAWQQALQWTAPEQAPALVSTKEKARVFARAHQGAAAKTAALVRGLLAQ